MADLRAELNVIVACCALTAELTSKRGQEKGEQGD